MTYGYRRRRRGSSGATKAPSKAVLMWDNESSRYHINTPFAPDFKNHLFLLCKTASAGVGGVYVIQESDVNNAKTLLAGTFGDYEFIPKPDSGGGFQMNMAEADGKAQAALKLLTLGGREVAKRYYNLLCNKYHPDSTSDEKTPDAELMGQLSQAWRAFLREQGW